MSGEALLSATPFGLRAALCDRGGVSHFLIESALRPSRVGDIHAGRVVRVMPQLGGGFVELGEGIGEGWLETARKLAPGEAVLVQVASDARGGKAPRLSLSLSLAGCGLVFMPARKSPLVSSRIDDGPARAHLAALIETLGVPGFIARRDAAAMPDDALRHEAGRLQTAFRQIAAAKETDPAPRRLWSAGGMLGRLLRDHLADRRLIVDDRGTYDAALALSVSRHPKLVPLIALADDEPDLFERHDAHGALEASLLPGVPFEGGALTIETTEALTAIDVDVSGTSLAEASRRAMDAAGRAILQRNLGGLIVLDAPRLKSAKARDAMIDALRRSLAGDRAAHHVHGVTPAGLIELTRQRIGESVADAMTERDGPGAAWRPRLDALAFDLAAAARRSVRRGARRLVIRAAPRLLAPIEAVPGSADGGFARWLGRPVAFAAEAGRPPERFEVETM
ncbi:MAG: ribonuclease E/G [Alphaproteobacteria bacterium]